MHTLTWCNEISNLYRSIYLLNFPLFWGLTYFQRYNSKLFFLHFLIYIFFITIINIYYRVSISKNTKLHAQRFLEKCVESAHIKLGGKFGKTAPYLHQKSSKWALNMVLFYAFVLMLLSKFVLNSTIRGGRLAIIFCTTAENLCKNKGL